MKEGYRCGWSTCLDVSMMRWNCPDDPGWVFVARKFTQKGNEFHTIADTFTKINFNMELVQGKDRPESRGQPEFSVTHGKTGGLLLRMTKDAGLWGSGVVVNLDSGFCVLDGLLGLRSKGIYGCAMIKKRRGWPKNIDGDSFLQAAAGLPLGECVSKKGTCTVGSSAYPFYVVALRDSCHVVLAMATHGTVLNTGTKVLRGPELFSRPDVFDTYYVARHSVDDNNNNNRQGHRGLEQVWETRTWHHRIFAYVLGVSETNAWLAYQFFVTNGAHKTLMSFREALVLGLFTRFKRPDAIRMSGARKILAHMLTPIPSKKRAQGGAWVDAPEHAPKLKSVAPQLRCCNCHDRTRFYCSCRVGQGMCKSCWGKHVIE